MAINDASVYQPAQAHILVAAVGTTAPVVADIDAYDPNGTPVTGFTDFGHTSLDNDTSPTYDGGDVTTRGSRQNALLRQTQATITEGMQINSIQVTKDTFDTYYGAGTHAAGTFDAPDSRNAIEKAVLIVYLDGARRVAEYHPRASMTSQGAIVNANDGWLEFPIQMTWLKQSGQPVTRWYADSLTS